MICFEGYYIKCQNKEDAIAVIFGYNHCKKNNSAFIQIIEVGTSHCQTYPISRFLKFKKGLNWLVGTSHLSTEGLLLDIDTLDLRVTGNLNFGPFTPLKRKAMGPFEFLPFMECKHAVVSMQNKVTGSIAINGKTYNFDNDLCYIEGDRGKSFPKKYFWSQAHLSDEISVCCSCATIPYLGIKFTGTICFAHVNGKEYRLATYMRAKVKEFTKNCLRVVQGRGKKKLELFVEVLDTDNDNPLLAPACGEMNRTVQESIKRKVRYKLTHGMQTVFDITSDRAAVEFSHIF